MTNDQISNFLSTASLDKSKVQINFRSRNSIVGIFIKSNDYTDLMAKNLWRIVSESKIPDFLKAKDVSVARIFNGVEITKLSLVKELASIK